VKPVPDGNHEEIIKWLQERCAQQRPDLWFYPRRELDLETGPVRPDGTLAHKRSFAGPDGQARSNGAEGVLMVVDVITGDGDGDVAERAGGYARAGIPVYLVIDLVADGKIAVHADPVDGRYREQRHCYGDAVPLPDPVRITLDDTGLLKEYVR
jgi:hypothetical protein